MVLDGARYAGPADSYAVLYQPPEELRGRINMFDSVSEVVDMASLYLGIPLCSADPKQMQRVLELLKAQKPFVKTCSSKAGSIARTSPQARWTCRCSGAARRCVRANSSRA